ncbi:hypothetical protein BJ508DRAFT_334607 [Ascobolus immersus RN42]|uniref:Uncharacterized protein n=1 Tax=Ascobolus immersus RN42 TaxID=1160509 RepID=A0A3N4HFD9_ASCIM|nr:hypothetical protein BJ508DRAFT_334607 [Ascobolus immersus RN42]
MSSSTPPPKHPRPRQPAAIPPRPPTNSPTIPPKSNENTTRHPRRPSRPSTNRKPSLINTQASGLTDDTATPRASRGGRRFSEQEEQERTLRLSLLNRPTQKPHHPSPPSTSSETSSVDYEQPVLGRVQLLKTELLAAQKLIKEQKEKIRTLEKKLKEETTNATTYGETALRRLEEKEQMQFMYSYKMENLEWMLYEKECVTERLRRYVEMKVGTEGSGALMRLCASGADKEEARHM